MPGSSPLLGLPYPVGTDRVSDGDNVIQALSTALDGTPGKWIYPALGSGWTTGAGLAGAITYRLDGVGNCHIQGSLGYTGGQPAAKAFILPVGYRPSVWISGVVQDLGSSGSTWPFFTWSVLNTTGEVNVGATPAQATLSCLLNIVFSTVQRPTSV